LKKVKRRSKRASRPLNGARRKEPEVWGRAEDIKKEEKHPHKRLGEDKFSEVGNG